LFQKEPEKTDGRDSKIPYRRAYDNYQRVIHEMNRGWSAGTPIG